MPLAETENWADWLSFTICAEGCAVMAGATLMASTAPFERTEPALLLTSTV